MPSPWLIWANRAEREAESSALEFVEMGAGGGGGPGGGGAAPAGGAGGMPATCVAVGPCKKCQRGCLKLGCSSPGARHTPPALQGRKRRWPT